MCWWASVAQAGLSIAGSVMGYKAQAQAAQAQGEAMAQQATYAVQSMNREFANYEIERRDAFDSAVQEITKTRLNAMQLNSQVEAAVAEEMAGGGRTADRIVRSAKADEARSVASIQDNYQRKSNEIDLNKETTLLSTKNYIAGLKPPSAPSKLGLFLDVASAGINAYTSGTSAKNDALSKGYKWDFWKGVVR
jgi:hypothetical protein